MRFVEPPSLTSPWRGQPGDLDGLLSAFFKSELPQQWPGLELPDEQPELTATPTPPAGRRPAWRSRLALAASVAVLLGGAGLLGGKFEEVTQPRPLSGRPIASVSDDMPVRMNTQLIQDPQSGQTGVRIDVFPDPGAAKKAAVEQLKNMLP